MFKKIMLAVALGLAAGNACAWELTDPDRCIATNIINWKDSAGYTQFGFDDDALYLSSSNVEWNLNTTNNPKTISAFVIFDGGEAIPASLYSERNTVVVLVLPNDAKTVQQLATSSKMTVSTTEIAADNDILYGVYLTDMFEAMYKTASCNDSKSK